MAGRKFQAVVNVKNGRGGIVAAVKLPDTATLFKLRMLAQMAGMRGDKAADESTVVAALIDAAFAADRALSGAEE